MTGPGIALAQAGAHSAEAGAQLVASEMEKNPAAAQPAVYTFQSCQPSFNPEAMSALLCTGFFESCQISMFTKGWSNNVNGIAIAQACWMLHSNFTISDQRLLGLNDSSAAQGLHLIHTCILGLAS